MTNAVPRSRRGSYCLVVHAAELKNADSSKRELERIGMSNLRSGIVPGFERSPMYFGESECVVVLRDGLTRNLISRITAAARSETRIRGVFVVPAQRSRDWTSVDEWSDIVRYLSSPGTKETDMRAERKHFANGNGEAKSGIISTTKSEALAALEREAQADAEIVKVFEKERDEYRDQVTHLSAENDALRKQVGDSGRVAREQMAADLAKTNAERVKALREVTDLTERLSASEARCRAAAVVAEARPSASGIEGRMRLLLSAWKGGAIEAEDVLKRIEKMIGGE